MPSVTSIPAFAGSREKPLRGLDALTELLKELRSHAIKSGKFSALNAVIAESAEPDVCVSGNIQTTPKHVIGSVTYSTDEQLRFMLDRVEGKVDVFLLDVDTKPHGPRSPAGNAKAVLKRTALLTYLEGRAWVEAVENQAVRLLAEDLEGVPVVIVGDQPKSRALAAALGERQASVTVLSDAGSAAVKCIAAAHLLIVWHGGAQLLSSVLANRMPSCKYILYADVRGFPPELRDGLQRFGKRVVRVDMWPTIAGTLLTTHESQRVCDHAMGWGAIAGVPLVAGGAMGHRGDVVVDSVSEPSRVIGVADGSGGVEFRYTGEESERVRKVSSEINSRIVQRHITSVA
jgi:hypothetical protein